MNELFIIVLAAFGGFMIGLALTKRGKERELYYKDVVKFCSHLINNISFKSDKLSSVLDSAEVKSGALNKNLAEYKAYIAGSEFNMSENCLTKFEALSVRDFFLELGRYDGDTQLTELKRRKGEFEQKFSELKINNDKYGNMYIKLGLLLGMLVGILLI